MGVLDFLDKAFDFVLYESAKNSRSTLIDAQRKAHSAGNTEAERAIKEKRAQVDIAMKRIEKMQDKTKK